MDKVIYIVGLILLVALMIKLRDIVRDKSKSALLRAILVIGGALLFIVLILGLLASSFFIPIKFFF